MTSPQAVGPSGLFEADSWGRMPGDRARRRKAWRRGRRQGKPLVGDEPPPVRPPFQKTVEEIHSRRAEEAGDKPVGGRRVDFLGRRDLFDPPLVQDDQGIADGRGLGLVVGHIEHCQAQPTLHAADKLAQLGAQGGVEVSERSAIRGLAAAAQIGGRGDAAAAPGSGAAIQEGPARARGGATAPIPPGHRRSYGTPVAKTFIADRRGVLENIARRDGEADFATDFPPIEICPWDVPPAIRENLSCRSRTPDKQRDFPSGTSVERPA